MNIKEYLNSKDFNKDHNLYIVKVANKNGDELVKIGYSSDIYKRLKGYYSHNPLTEVIETLYIDGGLTVEQSIHGMLPSLEGTDEWYHIDMYSIIKGIVTMEQQAMIIAQQQMEINKLKQDVALMRKFINILPIEDIPSEEIQL